MQYELHLTTRPDINVEFWGERCRWNGAKPIVLELSKGNFPRQVMSAGVLSEIASEVYLRDRQDGIFLWADSVRTAFWDFEILRTKLESELHNDIYAVKYFEAHFKSKQQIEPLPGTEVARNVLSGNWLLTRRVRDVSANEAERTFLTDYDVLVKKCPDLKVEMESCLMDDNEKLDNGWITK